MTEPLRNETISAHIDGVDVEIDFFEERGEQRSMGSASIKHEGVEYYGSLTLMEAFGGLHDDGDNIYRLSAKTINRIMEWAYDNGY